MYSFSSWEDFWWYFWRDTSNIWT